jgi:hypothetical protein
VTSLGEAARLAEAVAQTPGLAGSGALMTVADGCLTVRSTRDVWQLEPRHAELARAVSIVANAEVGAHLAHGGVAAGHAQQATSRIGTATVARPQRVVNEAPIASRAVGVQVSVVVGDRRAAPYFPARRIR